MATFSKSRLFVRSWKRKQVAGSDYDRPPDHQYSTLRGTEATLGRCKRDAAARGGQKATAARPARSGRHRLRPLGRGRSECVSLAGAGRFSLKNAPAKSATHFCKSDTASFLKDLLCNPRNLGAAGSASHFLALFIRVPAICVANTRSLILSLRG